MAYMSRYKNANGGFAASLKAFSDKTKQEIEDVFKEVVFQVGSSVVRLSPVDTGRFKANWQITANSPASGSLNAYDQSGNDTIARLLNEVQQLELGQIAYIVNNLVYSVPLEYGHSQQAPNGMVRITIARFDELVKAAVQKVSK